MNMNMIIFMYMYMRIVRASVITARWGLKLVVGLLSAWLISGCATPLDSGNIRAATANHPQSPNTATAHVTDDATAPAGLSAELLYELLLANIAAQRGHHQTAMDALSRAAHMSREYNIVAQAIELAAQLQDHQRVIDLSNLMRDSAPESANRQPANNARHRLLLAHAQLESGKDARALNILIDLARNQPPDGGEAVLYSIAKLLSGRPSDERWLPRFRRAIADSQPADSHQKAQLNLTAALLAAELADDEAFRELINQTLRLRPDWEIAASLKLTDLAVSQISIYADEFLREFPFAEQFRIHYGKLLQQTNQTTQALVQFETVLQQNAQSAESLFASGVIYLQQKNLPRALQRLSQSLVLDSQTDAAQKDQTRLYIADIKIAQQEFEAAAAMLREVLSAEYYLDIEIRRATIISKQDGIESAARHLNGIELRTENDAVRVLLASSLLYQDFNLPQRAREVLDAGIAKMPDNPDLLYHRGLLAAQMKWLALHERDMRALIDLQPDNAHAKNALGYTLADQTGRLREAFELISRALEMQPNDPAILDSMGWVHFRFGDNDQAIHYLRRAYATQKNAEIAAHLGEALWVGGKRREAREIWQQGMAWSPDNAVLMDTMKRFANRHSSVVPAVQATMWRLAAVNFAPMLSHVRIHQSPVHAHVHVYAPTFARHSPLSPHPL